jgi:hypothetical protein
MIGKRKPAQPKIDPDRMTRSQFARTVNRTDPYTRRIYLYDCLDVRPAGYNGPRYIAIFRNMFTPGQILALFGPGRYHAVICPYPGQPIRGGFVFYCAEKTEESPTECKKNTRDE